MRRDLPRVSSRRPRLVRSFSSFARPLLVNVVLDADIFSPYRPRVRAPRRTSISWRIIARRGSAATLHAHEPRISVRRIVVVYNRSRSHVVAGTIVRRHFGTSEMFLATRSSREGPRRSWHNGRRITVDA